VAKEFVSKYRVCVRECKTTVTKYFEIQDIRRGEFFQGGSQTLGVES